MSIATEILRLQKSKDMVAAAEKLKLSGVRKWHRLELSVSSVMQIEEDKPEYLGAGIWRLKRATQTTFEFNANVHSVYSGSNGVYSLCFVVLPIDKEYISTVAYNDTDDGQYPSDFGYILTEDLISDGLVSHDKDISMYMDDGALTLMSSSDEESTDVFIGVYSRCNEDVTIYDSDGNQIYSGTEYVDGTESIDELAVSIYKWDASGEGTMNDTADATATADDLRQGRTAYVQGRKISGTLAYHGNKAITYNEETYNRLMVIPSGIYKQATVGLSQAIRDKLAEYDALEAQLAEI